MGSAAKQRTLPENSRRSRTKDDLLGLIPRARRLQRFVMYWGFGEHQYDMSPCISLLAHGIFCSERRLTKLNVHESRRSLRLPKEPRPCLRKATRRSVRPTKPGTFSRNSSGCPPIATSDMSASRWSIWPWVKTKRRSTISRRPVANRPTPMSSISRSSRYLIRCAAIHVSSVWEGSEKPLTREVELLEKATQRDPSFALAYCALAKTQCDLFSVTGAGLTDLSRTHLELAKKAAEAALRVRPDSGDAH